MACGSLLACPSVRPSVSALVQSSLSQMPSEGPLSGSLKFLFHSAMGGLNLYITWTPEGLPMGKDGRLWVCQSAVLGTYHAGLWDIDAGHTIVSSPKPGLCIPLV